jgi:hypothetical protein
MCVEASREVDDDMQERVRSIASRLREFVGNRRSAPRYRTSLPFSVSLLVSKVSAPSAAHLPTVKGHTYDISATGLALIVPAIRVGGRYLTGEDHTLRIMLELPAATVQIHAAPVRYERLDEEDREMGYLIGVHITEMSDKDRALFVDYIKTLR